MVAAVAGRQVEDAKPEQVGIEFRDPFGIEGTNSEVTESAVLLPGVMLINLGPVVMATL